MARYPISWKILYLPLIQEKQFQDTGESMCTLNRLTALDVSACSGIQFNIGDSDLIFKILEGRGW